jgi:predicted NAD/FAD-binding protein
MNRLQNISKEHPFFVSLNPQDDIDEKKIYYETDYTHPLFDIETVGAQKEINKIQGKNGVWFAGAWLGNGFHEDGFESAINISKKFNSLPEWLK